MFVAVLVRRLREGVTFEEFVDAWRAEPNHFGAPVRVTHARRIDEPREIVSYAEMDVELAVLKETLARVADDEAERHKRISTLLEVTVVAGIYEVAGVYHLD